MNSDSQTYPPQTEELFQYLSKGNFLSRNSSKPSRRFLYETAISNWSQLVSFFSAIGLQLKKEDHYIYFAGAETKSNKEEKLERLFKYLDWLEIITELKPDFYPGLIHSVGEMNDTLEDKPATKRKLKTLYLKGSGEQNEEKLRFIIKTFEKDSFVEWIHEDSGKFLVLDSFHYLTQIHPSN